MTLVNVQLAQAGAYDVVVSNIAGSITSSEATLIVEFRLGDFNGDGNTDILWQRRNGILAAWYMDGATNSQSVLLSNLRIPPAWRVVGQADFNKDGSSDLLLEQKGSSRLAIWLLRKTELLQAVNLDNGTTRPPGWRVAGISDFNADGSSDILWENNRGGLAVWFLDGAAYSSSALLGGTKPLPRGWRVAGMVDLDGDGTKDVLLQHRTGNLAVWYMHGLTVVSKEALNYGETDRALEVVGSGDFNRDGHADLILQRADGRAVLWLMERTARITVLELNTKESADPVWGIVGPK